jgi:hypothetical protein
MWPVTYEQMIAGLRERFFFKVVLQRLRAGWVGQADVFWWQNWSVTLCRLKDRTH